MKNLHEAFNHPRDLHASCGLESSFVFGYFGLADFMKIHRRNLGSKLDEIRVEIKISIEEELLEC